MNAVQTVASIVTASHAQFRDLTDPWLDVVAAPPASVDAQIRDAADIWSASLTALASIPARSMPDVFAKAAALETCFDLRRDQPSEINGDQGLAVSLIRDIAALAPA